MDAAWQEWVDPDNKPTRATVESRARDAGHARGDHDDCGERKVAGAKSGTGSTVVGMPVAEERQHRDLSLPDFATVIPSRKAAREYLKNGDEDGKA